MKTFTYLLCSGMLVAFLLVHSASGDPVPATYSLTLPLSGNSNGWSQNVPPIRLTVTNSTPHTLLFGWIPHIDPVTNFHVDYKGPAEDPSLGIGWMPLKANAKPASKPSTSSDGITTEVIEHREKIVLAPRHNASFSAPLDFPMTEPGYYRISLVLTITEAYEFRNASDAKGLQHSLVLQSDHLVIVKTSSGYGTVSEQP